jgi:hypothetical protein
MSGKVKTMTKPQEFRRERFTETKFSTAEDKARFCRQFAAFVRSDFNRAKFPKWFYTRLSMTFGHIAHYDIEGFWATFFTSAADKAQFIDLALRWPCYGDLAYTYADAERAIQEWLKADGALERWRRSAAEEAEATERAQLERLQTKYGKA